MRPLSCAELLELERAATPRRPRRHRPPVRWWDGRGYRAGSAFTCGLALGFAAAAALLMRGFL